jgi:hypothetical protein
VSDAGQESEIMGHPNHGHAMLDLQALDEVHDLRLHGDIEGGGRLVGDEETGLSGQCHGDHDALAHPS